MALPRRSPLPARLTPRLPPRPRPRVSVLTPTCRRPAALALARRWMAAQTVQPDEWLILDGSADPPGALNLLTNLERGLAAATGDRLIIWEDDDYYDPRHLERLLALWDAHPDALLVGDPTQRYYHLPLRRYKRFANKGASLCQTGLSIDLRAWLVAVLDVCRHLPDHQPAYGVDGRLWAPALRGEIPHVLVPLDTVVGIKGLPGQSGLGIGHRREIVQRWAADPDQTVLRQWVRDPAAVDTYLALDSSAVPV